MSQVRAPNKVPRVLLPHLTARNHPLTASTPTDHRPVLAGPREGARHSSSMQASACRMQQPAAAARLARRPMVDPLPAGATTFIPARVRPPRWHAALRRPRGSPWRPPAPSFHRYDSYHRAPPPVPPSTPPPPSTRCGVRPPLQRVEVCCVTSCFLKQLNLTWPELLKVRRRGAQAADADQPSGRQQESRRE